MANRSNAAEAWYQEPGIYWCVIGLGTSYPIFFLLPA